MPGWPKPSEVAELTVNGTIFRDWETVMVKHAVFFPSYISRFTCSEGSPIAKSWGTLRIRPGMDCTVKLGGQLALTGIVYSRQVYYDAGRVHIEIQAVGHSHKTQTTSVDSKTSEWKKVNYQQFAKDILPSDIPFVVLGGALPTDKFERINLALGTSQWEALDYHARPLGIALTSNVQGAIVALVGPIGTGSNFVEGENILIGREIIFNLSMYRGTGFGQRTGDNQTWGAKAAQLFSKESTSSSSPFLSGGKLPVQLHQSEIPAWSNILKGRIGAERTWNSSDEITVFITVQGWLDGGALWGPPGTEYSITSPMLIMNGDVLKAKSITFTQDNSTGTRTTLELCNVLAMGQGGAAI